MADILAGSAFHATGPESENARTLTLPKFRRPTSIGAGTVWAVAHTDF